MMVQEDTIELK